MRRPERHDYRDGRPRTARKAPEPQYADAFHYHAPRTLKEELRAFRAKGNPYAMRSTCCDKHCPCHRG